MSFPSLLLAIANLPSMPHRLTLPRVDLADTEDRFSLGERMCFATSAVASGVAITALDDLAVSFDGGPFEVKLWSDSLTDPTIRVGEWVMLSRRIVRGNNTTTAKQLRSTKSKT